MKMGRAAVVLLVCTCPWMAMADEPARDFCGEKAERLQVQIDIAQAHGNSHRVRGLQRALDRVERHCTNQGVIEEAREELDELREEVEERRQDLREAQEEGDEEEIAERTAKLDEAMRDLQRHHDEWRDYVE